MNIRRPKTADIINGYNTQHRTDRRWNDRSDDDYLAPAARKIFKETEIERMRNCRIIGDAIQVADIKVNPVCIYDAVINKFDTGSRVVVTDRQGFLHFVEPTTNFEESNGASFVFQYSPTLKKSAGWIKEKNLTECPELFPDRRKH